MIKWDASIAFVLDMEGGYTLDPKDPGGETNYGISKKAYPHLDIKNLTMDQAKDIYRRDYWVPCRCGDLPFPFALGLFDMAVNQGVKTAIKTLQKSLRVEADGIMGPVTIGAAEKAGRKVIKNFLAQRLAAYANIMAMNPKLLVFAVNWSYRVISLADRILSKNGVDQQ